MSESSRKTHSLLTCLAFAMLIAYVGCTTTPSTVSSTHANTTTTQASVSSSASTSSSSASASTSSSTASPTSSGSSSAPTTGNTTAQATSPTSATGTVTTQQSSSILSSTANTANTNDSSTTTTTGHVNSTFASSEVTTNGSAPTATPQSSQSPGSSISPTTAAVTSNNTETPTTTALTTPESTTAAPTTPAPTTPAPTTPAPTTVTADPNSKPINPDATFLLTIDVGPEKNVSCPDCNSSYVLDSFRAAFENIPGFLYIEPVVGTTSFSVKIRFSGFQFQTLNSTEQQGSIWNALLYLNKTDGLSVMDSAREIAKAFADKCVLLCNTEDACNLGFDCKNEGCLHKCVNWSCGDHGTCSVTISSNSDSSPSCICNSDDETTYSGDRCQNSEISQKKVAAIVGGVLGAFCGLFIIIIIIMCCRQRGGSSSSKYQLGGTTNQGYSTMGMKEL